MVRSYLPDPIDHETIERIVGTVRRAPSAGFSQGHRLVVVTEPETRRSSRGSPARRSTSRWGCRPGSPSRPCTSSSASARRATTSATARTTSSSTASEITWPAPYWYVDAGSLFLLLQLAALSEGLGTGVYGVPGEDVPALKELLGLPDDVHFVCVVTIGRQPPERGRQPARLAADPGAQAARRARPLGALGALRRRQASACRRVRAGDATLIATHARPLSRCRSRARRGPARRRRLSGRGERAVRRPRRLVPVAEGERPGRGARHLPHDRRRDPARLRLGCGQRARHRIPRAGRCASATTTPAA